ncbi:MAG: hypothetical protein KIG39_01340 [Lachnospiraceae bacterium]|nr:hypothetical protein [Lachnospiraceae bacterium]
MTLLFTLIAAVISTLIWYLSKRARTLKIVTLLYLYWGASLMWLVDAVFEYIELRAAYFTPSMEDMINDSFLGLSVVVLGLIIWVIEILIKDPENVINRK